MIRYLEGQIFAHTDRGVIVLASGVGYDVQVNVTTRAWLDEPADEPRAVKLHISYQQSENQPAPRLYGFRRELERDFFEELIRVKDVGPKVALSVMSVPVRQIARAIVDGDVKTLISLKGVGRTGADRIIADLKNRVAKYALLPDDAASASAEPLDFKVEVRETLVKQLGFKAQEAQRLIEIAVKEKESIKSAEELFDEVLRLHK